MLPVGLGSSCSIPHHPGGLPPWAWLTPYFLSRGSALPHPLVTSSSSASSLPSAYPSPLPSPHPHDSNPNSVCQTLCLNQDSLGSCGF